MNSRRHTTHFSFTDFPLTTRVRVSWMLVGALCLADAGGTSVANELEYRPIASASPEPLETTGLTTREELEAFIDGVMASQLRSLHVAGATIAVVKDGELFIAKGYGYEDAEKKVPVDPERTLFRPASVSKLFTWTAVMQLVEQGKLDLDADVNTYLTDFKIPDTYPEPITIRNLLTHTAGFEDGGLGYLFEKSPDASIPLGRFLAKHMPARVHPPTTDFTSGTGVAYSNWGAALAGHIVATLSGLPFDEYMERQILEPLGMRRSTFSEPLPRELAARMSGAYTFEGGAFKRHGLEYTHNFGPAGSLSATATDMAKFMVAHLQNGAVGEARILREETARLMHTRALSPHPAMNGMCLGYFETWINGRRIIGHGGDTVYFHSVLMLLPEANVGLFVSYNSAGGGGAAFELQRAFMDRYFPARLPDVKPPSDFAERAARYTGTYRGLRRSYTRIDKVLSAASELHVRLMSDGTLLTDDQPPSRWVEVGASVFRKASDGTTIVFKDDPSGGHATHLFEPFVVLPYERIAWYEGARFHAVLLGLGVVLFISTIVSTIRRWRADGGGPARLRWARPALAAASILYLGFLAGTVITATGGVEILYGFPPTFRVALALPLLAILPTAAAVLFAGIAWRQCAWTWAARLHYTLATLAALAFLWVLNYWNLLGYRFG